MGEEDPRKMLKSARRRARPRNASDAAPTNRQVFHEMVKGEIEDRPLSWFRRRALVRFAVHLGMDPFEARLLVRAVEYECGHAAPAAMADIEPQVETDYLAPLGNRRGLLHCAMALLIGILAGLVLLGLR